MPIHRELSGEQIHKPFRWIFADETARNSKTITDTLLEGHFALQQSDDTIWMLIGTAPAVWKEVDSGGSASNIQSSYYNIGNPGKQGFGVGIAPASILPAGMSILSGTETVGHDNYGNYQFQDGSIVCCVPIHWMKIGTGSNGLDVNDISVVPYSEYASESEGNAAGYFLPRCFIDGGQVKACYFVDKYHCSKKAGEPGILHPQLK